MKHEYTLGHKTFYIILIYTLSSFIHRRQDNRHNQFVAIQTYCNTFYQQPCNYHIFKCSLCVIRLSKAKIHIISTVHHSIGTISSAYHTFIHNTKHISSHPRPTHGRVHISRKYIYDYYVFMKQFMFISSTREWKKWRWNKLNITPVEKWVIKWVVVKKKKFNNIEVYSAMENFPPFRVCFAHTDINRNLSNVIHFLVKWVEWFSTLRF